MLAKLEQHAAPLSAAGTRRISHLLVVQPKAAQLDARTPHLAALEATLARRKKKPDELAKSPVTVDAPGGAHRRGINADLLEVSTQAVPGRGYFGDNTHAQGGKIG